MVCIALGSEADIIIVTDNSLLVYNICLTLYNVYCCVRYLVNITWMKVL